MVIYTDGGWSPKGAYGSAVIYMNLPVRVHWEFKAPDNNVAEAVTIVAALSWLKRKGVDESVQVMTDSRVVIDAVSGDVPVRSGPLARWIQRIRRFKEVSLKWVPREHILQTVGH